MQGFNISFNISRYVQGADDAVGGSSQSVSLILSGVPGRIQALLQDEEMVFDVPGMETEKLFRVTCVTNGNIKENDLFSISFPTNHPYYGQTFRVVKVVIGNYKPKGYKILTLKLWDEALT